MAPDPNRTATRSSTWDKRSAACKVTWITLRLLHQHKRVFKTAGKLRMDQLTFWHASTAARRTAKHTLGLQIDTLFRSMYGATFEPGVTANKARAQMDTVLSKSSATIADLAAVADVQYEFFGEVPA